MFTNPFYEGFNFPFSGDVNQAINPWSWWSQHGLINVNLMASSNPSLEKRIVEDVASYGKQLGRIIDLLSTYQRHLPQEGWALSETDKKAINDFQDLARGIEAVKAGYAAPTRENIDNFIAGLKHLKRHDAAAYKQVVERIELELGGKTL